MKIKKQIRKGLPLVGTPPYGQIHLHSTANPKSTAQNEADYMNRKNINSGYFTHVVGNGQVIQTAPTNRGAWDVGGDWNMWGYASIELIESHKTQAEFDRDYKLYVELARKLADEAKIPKKLDSGNLGIITHDYARRNQPNNNTTHVDPYPYLKKWGISKAQLKKDIENGIKGKVSSKPKPNKKPPKKPAKKPSNKGKWIAERGKFHVGVATHGAKNISVSKLPLTVNATGKGAKIADIRRGQYIIYDAFMNDGKYMWIRQPRGNGKYGYMATGNIGSNGLRKDYWGKFTK